MTIILQYVANNAWMSQHARYTDRTDFLVGLLRTNDVRGTPIPLALALLWTFVNWADLMSLLADGSAIFISGLYRHYLDSRGTRQIA